MISLTRQESIIAELVAEGLPNKEIAARLGLAEGTVKLYVSEILRKTGLDNRVKLAVDVISGLVPVYGPPEMTEDFAL